MGHEFSGTIVDVGEGVQALSVGDNVVVEPYFVCDECPPCKAGNYHLCTKMGFIGLSGGGGGLGGMVVVDTRWVHKVGNIPLDQAALIEPLSVAHHAVARSGAKPGDVALVGGSGPIGLLTAAVLKSQGVTTVISELSAARKDKAISSGVADYVIDPGQEDLQARLLELTDGVGADVAFECAGVNAVLDTLLTAVKPAGVVVNVSIWGRPATVDMQKIVLKEIDLRGTIAYVRDHAEAIKLVQEGKVNLEPFITARIALEDLVEQGFNTLIHRNDTAVKILVHP
jgi:(R,R)-butanediol dehydrogenase/meso-butanediol dehydrogenase/diacetyl reductase